jgi:O-antigen/teichoic acid export membrane protein
LNTDLYFQNSKSDGVDAVLTRGAGGALAVKIGGVGIGFAVHVLLARLLGVEQYGVYAYVISWMMILALPSKLGMDMALVKFVAAYRARKEWGLLYGVIEFVKRVTLLNSLAVGGITSLVVWGIHSRLGTSLSYTFWLGCAALPLLIMLHIRQSALRAFRRVVLAGLSESVIQPLLLILLVMIVGVFFSLPLRGPLVMIFYGATLLLALLFTSKWLDSLLSQGPEKSSVKTNQREWLAVGLPLVMMSGFSLITQRADIIMIGAYLGTTKAGIYIAASRLANLLILWLAAANVIAAPLISELHAQGKKSELQKMISRIAIGVAGVTIPAGAGMILFAPWLLRLFGSEFLDGHDALLVLIVGQSVNALAGSVGYLLTMTGYQRQAALVMGIAACANLILNATLIPVFGLVGAALATTLSTVMWNGLMGMIVWRRLDLDPTILSVLRRAQ